jgi:hypothetical protein
MKKYFLFLLFFLIIANTDFLLGQETAGVKKLTIKEISKMISDADNSNYIKLHLNSVKSNQYSTNVIKNFGEVNSNYSFTKKYNSLTKDNGKSDLLKYVSVQNPENNTDISRYFPGEYKPWESSKHFGLAAFDELFFNIFVPWSLARFTRDWDSTADAGERWPFIGFQSIWSNIKNGWNYDGDNFVTNMFAHPYGGNIFFNSGRTNGYNFWESSAFAFAGSFIWETFMETNQPAINDWVITGMNGTSFGEILYRLSTLATDNTARGGHRVWTEIAGGLINPVRLFNRIVSGEISRVFPNPSWRTPEDLDLKFDAGTRVITNDSSKIKELEGIFDLTIEYGDQFRKKHNTPFSYFWYNVAFASNSPHLTSMNAIGSLFAIQLTDHKNTLHNLETTLNYNYLNNPGFVFGGASVVEQLNSRFLLGKGWEMRTKVGVRFTPMGGTPDDYFLDSTDGRNYDMGQGLGTLGRIIIRKGDWNIFSLEYYLDNLWTESEPSFSQHLLQRGEAIFQLPINDYFVMGFSAGFYKRNSTYNYPSNFFAFPTPDVSFQSPIFRVFFRTKVI